MRLLRPIWNTKIKYKYEEPLYAALFLYLHNMNDITNRADLLHLMRQFYNKLLSDDRIRYIFTDIAQIDLEAHLPHLADFWEQTLLREGSYRKNVMHIHLELNEKESLRPEHFQIWLEHFDKTVDEHFEGSNSELIKTRALSIATIMQLKISQKNHN